LSLLFLCAFVVYDPAGGIYEDQEVGIGHLPRPPHKQRVDDTLEPTAVITDTGQEQLDEELVRRSTRGTDFGSDLPEIGILGFAANGGGEEIAEVGGAIGRGGVSEVVSFMDVSATGRHFCIIADTSGSMEGAKLDYVKGEILQTVGSMKATARFQVIFYCNRAIPFPKNGWLHPRRDYPGLEKWLDTLYASGGTEPMTAFPLAFELEPAPDAIFFMTDGRFPSDVVDKVELLQRSKGRQVVIHTIAFMDRTAEALMQEMARNSGGTYRHVAEF
jgi:Mg-chelatase subunit ChlD